MPAKTKGARKRSQSRGRRAKPHNENISATPSVIPFANGHSVMQNGPPHLDCSKTFVARKPTRTPTKTCNEIHEDKHLFGFLLDASLAIGLVSAGIAYHCVNVATVPLLNLEARLLREVQSYRNGFFVLAKEPPLLLQILSSFITYYNGHYSNNNDPNIEMNHQVLQSLRLLTAITGSLCIPIVFFICRSLNLSRICSVLAAICLFDFYLVLHSSFVSCEPFFLLCTVGCLLFYVYSTHFYGSWQSLFWSFLCGLFTAFCLCLNLRSVYAWCLLLCCLLWDFWNELSNTLRTTVNIICHLMCRLVFLVVLPVLLYVFCFWIFVQHARKASPNSSIMSSQFQASLQGGFSTITKDQPSLIQLGSRVTLRNSGADPPCWLHSHDALYPVKYPDGRGSSHQQQVTCYPYKDVNNWWYVEAARPGENVVPALYSGNYLRLIHGVTKRMLNTHDVAAPLSKNSMEVSCYVDHNISMDAYPDWILEMTSPNRNAAWRAIGSKMRLRHLPSAAYLRLSELQLPAWGFGQFEVIADPEVDGLTEWNVEEHKLDEDEARARAHPVAHSEFGFWRKFAEIQERMVTKMMAAPANKPKEDEIILLQFEMDPITWLTATGGNVEFWKEDTKSMVASQNLWLQWLLNGLLIAFWLLSAGIFVLKQRIAIISTDDWNGMALTMRVIGGGLLLNYLSLFMSSAKIFTCNFLIAFVLQVILAAAALEQVSRYIICGVRRYL